MRPDPSPGPGYPGPKSDPDPWAGPGSKMSPKTPKNAQFYVKLTKDFGHFLAISEAKHSNTESNSQNT